MIINFKKIFILIILLFLSFTDVKAGNAYKNELTKVGLSSIGSGDVKVTLYMAKPYTEPLRLLKKNDGEFVLILPETYTSAPQKPSISDVMGEVTDADIKLYSFASNTSQNGYTKIVIKTNGLANLYPETVTTGGGTLHKTQSQVNKFISEQIKPTQQTSQPPKPENKIVSSNPNQQQIKVPEIKVNSQINIKQDKTVENKTDTKNKTEVKKQETVKDETRIKEEKTETEKTKEQKEQKVLDLKENPEFQNIEEIKNLPNITGKNTVDESVEEIKEPKVTPTVPFKQRVKNKLSNIKSVLTAHVPDLRKIPNQSGNILVVLVALIIAAFSIKFAISVLKNSGQKQDEFETSTAENKNEYSDFFKNIVDSKDGAKKSSIPNILSERRDYTGIEIEQPKSHKEIMNEDPNLTWQEKFRALQKNKKSLLQDSNDEAFSNNKKLNMENMENTGNMNIENPIKKLTQDFRAVKKVLEKQSANKDTQDSLKQEFTPEKLEKIEVISFEDLQNTVQKPKVQVNATTPIKAKEPKILTKLKLDENKGFYLVDYKEKVSLIGYVNDKIFKLNSYSSVKVPKLYARLTDKTDSADTYIVKIDSSKLLVDVDNEQMKLKLMY